MKDFRGMFLLGNFVGFSELQEFGNFRNSVFMRNFLEVGQFVRKNVVKHF